MLGTAEGNITSLRAMNNRGQITGVCYSRTDSGELPRGFVWDKTTGMRELKTPDGSLCCAESINDAGQILVSVEDPNDGCRWFILDSNGAISLGEAVADAASCTMNKSSCVAGTRLALHIVCVRIYACSA